MTEVQINVFLEAFESVNEVAGSMGLLVVSVSDKGVELVAIDEDMAGDLGENDDKCSRPRVISEETTQQVSLKMATLYE